MAVASINSDITGAHLGGLHADTKPTTNVPKGYIFLEYDTGNKYIFDGTTWWPIAAPVSIVGSLENLLTAVSASGAGSPIPVNSYKNYIFEVYGTATSFDIQIQAIGPSGTPRNLKVWDELNNVYLTGDIVAQGFYSVSVPAFTNIMANVVSVSGGVVNIGGGLTY